MKQHVELGLQQLCASNAFSWCRARSLYGGEEKKTGKKKTRLE